MTPEDTKNEIALLDSRGAVEKYLADTKTKINGLLISSQDSVNMAQETIRIINKAVERAEEIRKKENEPSQKKIDENNGLYKPITKGFTDLKEAINSKLKAFAAHQKELQAKADAEAAALKRARDEDALETAILGIWQDTLDGSYVYDLGEHLEDFLRGIAEMKKQHISVPDIPGKIKDFFQAFCLDRDIAYEMRVDPASLLKRQAVQETLQQAAASIQESQAAPALVQAQPQVKIDGRLNQDKYNFYYVTKDGVRTESPDMTLIPPTYALPNEKLLKTTATQTKGNGIVPGVKFYKEA